MSSEHAIEKVPLSEIREGDMLRRLAGGSRSRIPPTTPASRPHRVYYGDGGEEIDSRYVAGLVNRQGTGVTEAITNHKVEARYVHPD